MNYEIIVTVVTVVAVFVALAKSRLGAELILLAGLTVLMLSGVLTPNQALAGFSNPGIITIGVLFVVAAGIRDTGAVSMIVDSLLRMPKTVPGAVARMATPVAAISAFMNNTPLVAMMIPAVIDWARRLRMPVSKFLIPLSYAAVLGGICTLIGTSTNLLVDGMVRDAAVPGFPKVGFFQITPIGIACTIVGIGFLVFSSKWLLPDRTPPVNITADPREYVLEMLVEPGSPLVGKTIEQAGLRSLPGVFLMEIDRNGEIMAAVPPSTKLDANDRLVFVGIVDSVVDLQKIRGLKPATDQVFKLQAAANQRSLLEAVVSNSSPIIGKSIRESQFRKRYNAVVIAAARNGERIHKKIGDIVVRPGDTLLLEAAQDFQEIQKNSRDFYLISRIEGYTPPRHDRAWIAIAILAGLVISTALFQLDVLLSGAVAAALMLITRCCSTEAAHRAIEWRVLMAIAAALGLGKALEVSGAARMMAEGIIGAVPNHPIVILAAIYFITVVLTELITNNAAAALVFPIALNTANQAGLDFQPFVLVIMVAASAGFATPLGYQTHLMVYGPGGYRFSDFLRIGIPMDILVGIVALVMISLLYF